jgi:large subunit ribosomal protein L1
MSIAQAVAVLRAAEAGAATRSIHLAIRLKQDKSATPLRGSIALPKNLPSKTKIAVFARGQDAIDAKSAGAFLVGAEDLVQRIQDGVIDFDKCLATPECVPLIGKLARTLGPKGLMPSAKRGTVVKNVGQAITDAERNLDFRQKGSGSVLRLPVARCSFSDDEIKKNIEAVLVKIGELGSKPVDGGSRGLSTIEQVVCSSAHGPGIPLNLEK